jgi:choline kinase
MTAIILAAGVGKRLAAVTRHRPKCLIEFGGRSLLDRYVDGLRQADIHKIAIVVGHKQELIRAAMERHREVTVGYVENHQYQRGSLYSLWLAGAADIADDLLIMDADVLCPASFITRLVRSPHPNAILLDETVRQRSEERMAVIRAGRVVALTKKPEEPYDLIGEGVGFLKVTYGETGAIMTAMEPYVKRGELDLEYEDTWEAFFRAVTVGYEKIGGQPWIEIDFPEDVERAEREILPRLSS